MDETRFKVRCDQTGDQTFCATLDDMPRGALMLMDDALDMGVLTGKQVTVTFFTDDVAVCSGVGRAAVLAAMTKEREQ